MPRAREESNPAPSQTKPSFPHSPTITPIHFIRHCFHLQRSYTSPTYLVYVVLTFFDISDWIFTGVNQWFKLQIRLVAAIKGFNRSWLSCKKKYKSILADYRNDKRANEVSGADRHQEYKWFTEMDEWHGNTASVNNQIPASATESNFEDIIPSTPPSQTTTATTPNSTTTSIQDNKKKKTQEKIELLLEQVVGNSVALLSSFQESTNILKNMDRNFAALLEKF
jgi:hypothetical protein